MDDPRCVHRVCSVIKQSQKKTNDIVHRVCSMIKQSQTNERTNVRTSGMAPGLEADLQRQAQEGSTAILSQDEALSALTSDFRDFAARTHEVRLYIGYGSVHPQGAPHLTPPTATATVAVAVAKNLASAAFTRHCLISLLTHQCVC